MSHEVMDYYRKAVEMVTAPGAFLELTTIEVGGQALKAYQHAPGSMRDLWLLGQGFADQEYIVYGDERWTFSEAGQIVASFANWLQAQGIGPRDRVAIARVDVFLGIGGEIEKEIDKLPGRRLDFMADLRRAADRRLRLRGRFGFAGQAARHNDRRGNQYDCRETKGNTAHLKPH